MAIKHLAVALFAATLAHAQQPAVIGYIQGRNHLIAPNEVAATKLTRIQYAFLLPHDGIVSTDSPTDDANLKTLIALKRTASRFQVVASIGGGAHSEAFSGIALTPESRARFIASCIAVIDHYHLDGVDIDWEYPASPRPDGQSRPEDTHNYTLLLRDLRQALDKHSPHHHLVLSTAVNGKQFFLRHVEMAEVQSFVDAVEIMGYDVYNESSPTTGHASPLFTSPEDPYLNSDATFIRDYLAAGVPASKLILGVPFYGRAWANVPATNNGLFQPVAKGSATDILTTDIMREDMAPTSGFVRFWDKTAQVPWLYNPTTHTLITYDDPESLAHKAHFVLEQHLGGIMFWAYSGDPDNILVDAMNVALRHETAGHETAKH